MKQISGGETVSYLTGRRPKTQSPFLAFRDVPEEALGRDRLPAALPFASP